MRSIFQAVLVTASDDWSGSSGRPAAELLLGMVPKKNKKALAKPGERGIITLG